MVPRAEADRALRKAAELGHPFSTQMLAILLDRGGTVKRDPVAARYWAERALDNPAKDASRGDLAVFLGSLLAASDKPEERARGLDILEQRSVPGYYQYGARTRTGAARSARTTRCARESCSRRRAAPIPAAQRRCWRKC